ncbi:MAG: ankyrin repeat domain-containing protein [Acidobacteria bacterium]|nr:ankyrin repeat domain-containing protein [Acidobacteriota bacterium]
MGRTLVVASAVVALLGTGATSAAQPASSSETAEALSEAARRGDAAAVKKLLDEGVDVNTKFRYGVTVLSYAADRGHDDVVKLLLDRGADPNVRDTFYRATPLTWAVSPAMGRKPQHAEVVRLLLQHGAQGKEAALMPALSDQATTKVILESGGLSAEALADALEAASRRKLPEIVALLEQAGAKPHSEFKMTDAELARFGGTYRAPTGAEIVLTVVDGRLTGGPSGQQRTTFVARNATTFAAAGGPTLRFRMEADKPASFTVAQDPGGVVYTRVEGK